MNHVVPYQIDEDGKHSLTKCPHFGAFWARNEFVQIRRVGERVDVNVGTNGCANCIFHKETRWGLTTCLFLKADQKFVDRKLRNK